MLQIILHKKYPSQTPNTKTIYVIQMSTQSSSQKLFHIKLTRLSNHWAVTSQVTCTELLQISLNLAAQFKPKSLLCFLTNLYLMGSFLAHSKMPKLSPSTRVTLFLSSLTIDQFHFYQYSAKFSRKLCIPESSVLSKNTTYSMNISLAFKTECQLNLL